MACFIPNLSQFDCQKVLPGLFNNQYLKQEATCLTIMTTTIKAPKTYTFQGHPEWEWKVHYKSEKPTGSYSDLLLYYMICLQHNNLLPDYDRN